MSEHKGGNKNPNSGDDSSKKRKRSPERPKINIKSFFTSNGKLFVVIFMKNETLN